MRNDIFSENFELTPNAITMILIALSKSKQYHVLGEFLMQICSIAPRLKPNTKVLAFKLAQRVEDPMAKSQIQTLVERLFSPEVEAKRSQDYYAKRRVRLLEVRKSQGYSNAPKPKVEEPKINVAELLKKSGPKPKKDLTMEEELDQLDKATAQGKLGNEKTQAQKKADKKAEKVEKAKAKADKSKGKSGEIEKVDTKIDVDENEEEEVRRLKLLHKKLPKKMGKASAGKRKLRITPNLEKFFLEYESVNNPDAITELD